MMTINEFIRKYRVVEKKDYNGTKFATLWENGVHVYIMNPYVICKDDFTFSAQASYTHYSKPKGLANEYEEIEIGFPSYNDPIIAKYREDYGCDETFSSAVYGYVPVKVVDRLIAAHGGIDEQAVQDQIADLKENMEAA